MRVVLATHNRAKLAELARLLPQHEVTGLPDDFTLGPETGATFAANALAKAREAAARTGCLCVADDSGLTVDVLGGMPGLLSARWCGRHGDDAANLELLLAQLADVPQGRRGAAFICAASAVDPDGWERVVHGVVRGSLLAVARGSGGFGYDPIFVPLGQNRTTAEMSPSEKDAISHRGQAMQRLAELLKERR